MHNVLAFTGFSGDCLPPVLPVLLVIIVLI